jgi:predicted ATPase
MRKFVIDGPPGSGKTTLLFGQSDSEEKLPCPPKNLSMLGFNCLKESAAEAYFELTANNIEPMSNQEYWFQRIVEMEKEKYLSCKPGNELYFFDRSFHHWVHFRQTIGIKLPDWYDEFNAQARYDDPVFLFSPILSFDLTKTNGDHRAHVFTKAERLESYRRTLDIYQDLGYRVVEVPVFSDDILENAERRIELILDNI